MLKKGMIEVDFWHHTVQFRECDIIKGKGSYYFVNGYNSVNLTLKKFMWPPSSSVFSHFSGKNLSLIVEQFILQDADGGGESSPQLWCYSGVSTMVLLWWVPCPTLVLLCQLWSSVVPLWWVPSILVLLWCSTVATYGTSLDSGVLLCTCGESPVQCASLVYYCGTVVLLWCLHWFVNCATLVFHWGTTVKFTVVLLWCVNCGVSLWWVQCASSQVCPGLQHPCSSTRHTVDQV